MGQTEIQGTVIHTIQLLEETVGQGRLDGYGAFQEKRSHHRHISERQQQGSDDTEHQGLGHRSEVLAFNSCQGQYREEHNQNNQYGKRRAPHHITGTFFHFLIHLLLAQCAAHPFLAIDVCQNTFQYHDGTVYHNTKVDGSQTHQVGRHTEYPHQDKGKEHGQGNDGRHNQSGTYISQEHNQYEEHDNGSFHQVTDNGRDIPVHQFRTVQVGLYADTLGQHLLYLGHPLLQFLGHHIGVGSFQHHGDTSHALTFSILGHGSETLGSAIAYFSDVAHMHGNPAPVGHDNLLNIFQVGNHTFRADVIRPVHLFYIASSGILVVAAQRIEHITDGDVQRIQGIRVDGHLILFQVTSETVDFHDTRDT